jgi:hypothetical protein
MPLPYNSELMLKVTSDSGAQFFADYSLNSDIERFGKEALKLGLTGEAIYNYVKAETSKIAPAEFPTTLPKLTTNMTENNEYPAPLKGEFVKIATPDGKLAYVSKISPDYDKQVARISLEWGDTESENESLTDSYTFPARPFTRLNLATSAGESEVYINKNSTHHDEIVDLLLKQYQTHPEALYTTSCEYILEISTKDTNPN